MNRHGLTPIQHVVAERIAAHATVKQIAAEMGVTHQAVHQHIDQIIARWQLDRSRTALTQIAERLRLVTRAT